LWASLAYSQSTSLDAVHPGTTLIRCAEPTRHYPVDLSEQFPDINFTSQNIALTVLSMGQPDGGQTTFHHTAYFDPVTTRWMAGDRRADPVMAENPLFTFEHIGSMIHVKLLDGRSGTFTMRIELLAD